MSLFTRMEVLDLIYHKFFSTADSLGRQPTTSQFFHPLSPQTLALVAAGIRCALSEYATGKDVMVMFSQDEYGGLFCPSTVKRLYYCRSHRTTHQFHMVGCFIPPPPPSPMVHLCWNRRSAIPDSAHQSGLVLPYLIQRSPILSPTSIRSTSISFQAVYLPPLSVMLSMDGCYAG